MGQPETPPSSTGLHLLYEVVSTTLAVVTVGSAATATAAALRLAATGLPWWALTLLGPVWFLLFLLALTAALFMVRLLVPRLSAGHHASGAAAWRHWGLHFMLRRLWANPLWAGVLMTQPVLRFLSLRALGAQVAFDINTAMDTMFTDPSLLRIDRGAMVSGGCVVGGHFVENSMLLLGTTHIGEGAQLLSGCKLGPAVTIGPYAVLGPDCRVAPQVVVGRSAHLGAFCLVSAGVSIGDDVVLGHGVVLEANVVLEAGAVVPSYARVPKGTVVASGSRFKPAAAPQV